MPSISEQKNNIIIYIQRDMSTETDKKEMEQYFGHEHWLIFNESEENINPSNCCNACGLRVLSSPCYMCTVQGCGFCLHEPCTRLPHKLNHIVVDDQHDLRLLVKPNHENCKCSKCGELCKNFTYHCDECADVDLHPLCGYPLDIRINHISHKQHPMVAINKECLLLCDVCGRKHNGIFFSCHQCNFFVHHDCASLPSFLRVGRHRHPLSLMYSDAFASTFYNYQYQCIICEKYISRWFGSYVCLVCDEMAHVDCAVSAMENQGKIYNLPPLDDAVSSWITIAVQNTAPKSDGETQTMLGKYHSAPHSLISNDETARPHESVCNACIRHIAAPPYYSCTKSSCDFLLHNFCVDLPLVSDDLFDRSRDLVFPRRDEFFSLFFCELCLRLGNGFGYSYSSYGGYDIFHVECALAPQVIKHDSHKQHPLTLGFGPRLEDIRSCCRKMNPSYYDIYSCTQCSFSIHIHCALLPKTVAHKFDEHPLTLITDSSAQDLGLGDDHFCEFCEKDINLSCWFYRCIKCDHSFHVECIPSTGKYSRIKFGGTVVLPSACHGGDHTLSLVRMLGEYSQTCGVCHEIIQGFKDGMALQCAECDFWIHFTCGSESSGATVSEPYRHISALPYYFSRYVQ
ncbi:uncharacterized protein [Henckelia pumila]|uniref:uncharacterized protein n=1 Tax=Henckelia pumila TaxID=405737 RepID=UPI003C6DBE5B